MDVPTKMGGLVISVGYGLRPGLHDQIFCDQSGNFSLGYSRFCPPPFQVLIINP